MDRKIFVVLIFALIFCGCIDSNLNIKINYDQIQGLKEGDRVFFDQNHIGRITKIFYSEQGHYVVDLSIEKRFANAATEHSKFFIIADPQNQGKKAIEMIQSQKGGTPLQEGASIQGSTRSSVILGQMRKNFEKSLGNLKEQFEQFFENLKGVPETEELKKLEKELERLAEEMKRSSKSVQEKIQKEILPRLKEEIEKLREQLQKFGRKEELEPLETQMKKIMEI